MIYDIQARSDKDGQTMLSVQVNLVPSKQTICGDLTCNRKEHEEPGLSKKLPLRADGNQKCVEEFLGAELMNSL